MMGTATTYIHPTNLIRRSISQSALFKENQFNGLGIREMSTVTQSTQSQVENQGQMQSRVWFITGCSSGFGYRIAKLALARGDSVIATARSLPKLQRLIDECSPFNINSNSNSLTSNNLNNEIGINKHKKRFHYAFLDLGDGLEKIKSVVDDAVKEMGKIDVLVNNAGWGQPSLIEEQGSQGIQEILDTNVMGTVNVTLSVVPYMREKKSGAIVTIGSRSAWRAEFPGIGSYAMIKAAIHAFTENLSAELAPLNIRTLIIQPGSFRTEGIYSHGFNLSNQISDYDPVRTKVYKAFTSIPGNEPGNPDKAAQVIVDVIRGEGIAKDRPWPKYLILGEDAERDIRNKCSTMLNTMDEWKDVVSGVKYDVDR